MKPSTRYIPLIASIAFAGVAFATFYVANRPSDSAVLGSVPDSRFDPVAEKLLNASFHGTIRYLEDPDSLKGSNFGLTRIPFVQVGDHRIPMGFTVSRIQFSGNKTDPFHPDTMALLPWSGGILEDRQAERDAKRFATRSAAFLIANQNEVTRFETKTGYFKVKPVIARDDICTNCHIGTAKGGVIALAVAYLSKERQSEFLKLNPTYAVPSSASSP